jgi:hypothetical protein
MRFSHAYYSLVAAALLAAAPIAAASPVTLAPVSFSAEFRAALADDLGAREGDRLSAAVTDAVTAALVRRGASVSAGAPLVVEISIMDADPNRPTMQQLVGQPSLDAARSISIGGADLRAVMRGAGGEVLQEVDHRRYNHDLNDLAGAATTWTEARRAIRQFAEKVADAYVASAR